MELVPYTLTERKGGWRFPPQANLVVHAPKSFMAIYACSDIHGQYGLYKKMLEGIGFSDDDKLYVIGDAIDRGPESIPLLKDIFSRKNVTLLLGNHELMMYTHYRLPDHVDYWMLAGNGGNITDEAFLRLDQSERDEILDTMENLHLQEEVYIDNTVFLLSHSYYVRGQGTIGWKTHSYNTVFDTVWFSPWRLWEYVPFENYAGDGRIHIIGHVPVQVAFRNCIQPTAYMDMQNRIINIDLGCASIGKKGSTGRLCCMNLNTFAQGDVQNAFMYFSEVYAERKEEGAFTFF